MTGQLNNSVVNLMLSNCVQIRLDVPSRDAGDISMKETAEHLPQNNFHATPTFLIRHTQMRRRSALEGATVGAHVMKFPKSS